VSAYCWGKKHLRGSVYDLSHLDPFVLDVHPCAEGVNPLKVIVSFGMHTFTRKRKSEDTSDLFMGKNGDPRSFCPVRYACSLYLPNLIRSAGTPGCSVYFSHRENFLVVDHVPAVKGEYAAVFKIECAKTNDHDIAARMFVISAHERINPLATLEKISFFTLVRKTSSGEPLRHKKK
jgi:hypothetical protein